MQERPRIGLVGAGGIVSLHAPNLVAFGEVTVFAHEGAGELAAQHGMDVVTSLDELIAVSDVVLIATPTHTHHEIARRVLGAGIPVIAEKPLARTSAQSAELIDLARRAGVPLFPAHVVRYFPAYAELRRAVESGRLGELAVLRFSRSSAYPAGAEWYGAEELSGGIILDQMIHDLDQARWLAGEVESVFAQATRRSQGDPVHAAHVLLRHTSGAISSCAGVWGPPHLEFTTAFSVAGSLGRLEYSSSRETELSFDLAPVATDGGHLPALSAAVDPYALEVADFLRSLRTGSTPRVTAEDGHEAVRIAEAAVLSARTGQLVRVSETGVAR